MGRVNKILSLDERTKDLLYLGSPLIEENIREIEAIRNNHVIPKPNGRYFYESLIYAIANQRVRYESVTKFMKMLHSLSDEQMKDADLIYNIVKQSPIRWHTENRFEGAFNFMEQNGGIEKVVRDYIQNGFEVRNMLSKNVKYIQLKTATLWHLCLGGKDPLICLDIHVTRQLAHLGGNVRESSYIPQTRNLSKNSRKKREVSGLQPKEYLDAEKQVIDIMNNMGLIEKYRKEFFNGNGHLDGSMVNALLWWIGAKSFRGESFNQLEFFPEIPKTSLISPYTPLKNEKA